MRIVGHLKKTDCNKSAGLFSAFLKQEGIDNEISPSPHENDLLDVWVIDEDELGRAETLLASFQSNPKNPIYQMAFAAMTSSPPDPEEPEESVKKAARKGGIFSNAPYGKVSMGIILVCVILFVWSLFQKEIVIPPKIEGIAEAPIVSPLDQTLLYDWPAYFQTRSELLSIYTPKQIEDGLLPSPAAKKLIVTLTTMRYWTGIYQRIISHFDNGKLPLLYDGPIFEKIGQGEVWRLITPALLHANLLHIFFNVLWFIMLGNQTEQRLGSLRFLSLVLLAAILSNTAQYLMSGSFFMGLSGVVCALAGFIFARQQVAPWEGYLLHRMTLLFLGVFVFGLFALQLALFFAQLFGVWNVVIPMANTAHITGGLTGYVLGRLPLFQAIKIKK